jgi:hypothetical protein
MGDGDGGAHPANVVIELLIAATTSSIWNRRGRATDTEELR